MRPCGFLAFLVLSSVLAAQTPEYDLLLKGGHVLDPKNGVDAVRDLAIADGRIATIEPEIPSSKAKKTLDAGGLYVTPGLIDSHFHAFSGTENSSITAGLSSIFPDHVTFGSCVTTVVDVGSSGWRRFEDFRREVIDDIAPTLTQERFGIEPELTSKIARRRLRVYEQAISYSGRTYDEGKKITWRDGLNALWCIVRYGVAD